MLFKELQSTASEWWISVPKRWWDMLKIPLSTIPFITGIITLIIWSRGVKPPLPAWNLGLIIGGALLFIVLSFFAFHRVRMERDQFKPAKSYTDADITLMQWRREYRQTQVPEASQIPPTLKAMWSLVDTILKEKMKKGIKGDKLLNMVAELLQINRDDPILTATNYTTEDKITKITKRVGAKMGFRKRNAQLEADWRKRLAETMDENKIGLLLSESADYMELKRELYKHIEPITRTQISHRIDDFIENLYTLYSIRLLISYGKTDKKLYIFPREMRELLKRLGDNVEKVMRNLFVRINDVLEGYSVGEELRDN